MGFRAGTAVFSALLAASLAASPLFAQNAPPRFETIDANGVDLVTGAFNFSLVEGAIGSGDGAVAIDRIYGSSFGVQDRWSGRLYRRTVSGTTLAYVEFGSISETFTISGSTYTSTKADGGTLVDQGGGVFRYTAEDGTKVDYLAQVDDTFT